MQTMTVRDCRDRTVEFFSTIDAFRKQLPQAPGSLSKIAPSNGFQVSEASTSYKSDPFASNLQEPLLPNGQQRISTSGLITQKSQFNQAASHISKSIVNVASKLEQLTKLAKQRSLFNDPANEINKLTFVIKHDITHLNGEIDLLEQFARSHTARTQPSRHHEENSKKIVAALKSKLADTTKNFTDVLHVRTKNLKEQNTRRKEFEAPTARPYRKRNVHSLGLLGEDEEGGGGTGEEGDPLLMEQPSHTHLQLQQQQQPVEDEYLNSRAAAVESIESTITELGQMYGRLVNLLGTQEDLVIRIDANMDEVVTNIEEGHNQLIKHFERISSSQWLIIKIFCILVVFILIFVGFIM